MIKLIRDEMPQEGLVFVAMPYRAKQLPDGTMFDFDDLYGKVYVPTILECGMKPQRADLIFGSAEGVFDTVWRGVQRAEVVLVDLTIRSVDVALELMMAITLNKRLVVLAQSLDDVPVDVRGHVHPILYNPVGLGVATLIQGLKSDLNTARARTVIENTLVPFKEAGTEPMPGVVVVVTKDRAVVETGDRGHRQLFELSNADVDYSRLVPDMTRLYKVGDRAQGAVATDFEGVRRYTMLADRTNPWQGLVADFPVGRRFASRVVNVPKDKGGFVSVAHGINGHVPVAEARQANLLRDMEVEVEVVRVDPVARKVDLRLHRVLTLGRSVTLLPHPTSANLRDLPTVGMKLTGHVKRAEPEQGHRGGFILLRLADYPKAPLAILHCTQMSRELREDLNDSGVDLANEKITVEVVRVDAVHARIDVMELVEDDDSEPVAAAV
jgi:small subunit ribosomal protein S1